jgi:tetratricopeptide (TPR) repeat protein
MEGRQIQGSWPNRIDTIKVRGLNWVTRSRSYCLRYSFILILCGGINLLGGLVRTTSSAFAAPNQTASARTFTPRSIELNEQGVKAAQAGKIMEAEGFFRKALSSDPYNLTAVFNLAGMYLQNQKNDSAIALLEEYYKRIPQDLGIAVRLGDAWFVKKDIKRARQYYTKAFEQDKSYPGVAQKLATLALLTRDLPTAEKMLELATQQQPKNFGLLENLSSVYIAMKKPQKAITVAQQALNAGATSPEVYVTLGTAYESLGQLENALSAFNRAQKLGADDKELPKHIARLEEALE